ncbi:hypothetical protein PV11_09919 [Exophiala sideris]|uniref:alpha-1,2-Mannosidase n=1 Tax=Exophiala sideris TaxID=1016849 RepID=A0A0D1WSV3_9EURO|nr:hypothetical protein PV11_09919 [Exophiala sideris]
MSFQVPQNVPFSTTSQRAYEDTHWRQKHSNGHATGGTVGAVTSKINDIFTPEKGLPMYKDKPNNYPPSRRKGMLQRRRTPAVIASIALVFLWWMGWLPWSSGRVYDPAEHQHSFFSDHDWSEQREAVKEVFKTSWAGYEKYAWGMDEYHPLTRKGKNMVEGGMGWIIVDALDTAMMMNLTTEVAKAREWISTSLSYTADHDVNTFETTIRMLGGLLSAYYLSTAFPHLAPQLDDDANQPGEDLYIEKATDLADRLLGAYESPSGIPYASVNLNTSHGITSHQDGGASSTAEAATLQLEMKYLAKITGEPHYWHKAENIMKVIDAQRCKDGLLPIFIYPATGQFRGENIRLGSRGDSYYEYLIKQYLQTGKAENIYLEMWDEALEGVKKHLITYSEHASLTILAERQDGLDKPLTAKMDHLVCFMPGTIALGVTEGQTVAEAKARLGSQWTKKHDENLKLAEELMKTCWGMYEVTATGLAPEIAYFKTNNPPRQWQGHTDPSWTPPVSDPLSDDPSAAWRSDYDIHSNDAHNLQRPETVESLFYMYRITKDPIYRQWGWEMFEAFREHEKVVDEVSGKVYAYTSLDTVMNIPVKESKRRDNMESFWLAETLKYFYLLFSDDSFFPLDSNVFNTEAHPMPKFDISGSKVFTTGWQRSTVAPPEPPPGSDGKIVRVDPEEKAKADAAAAAAAEQAAIGVHHDHGHDETKEREVDTENVADSKESPAPNLLNDWKDNIAKVADGATLAREEPQKDRKIPPGRRLDHVD